MTDTTRDAFEAWYSGDGKYPESINREGTAYKLIKTSLSWWAWEKATLAAQSKRQPLRDVDLFANDDLMALNATHAMQMSDIVKIVRVIETAHGITATPQGKI